jgi:hypothetical protein
MVASALILAGTGLPLSAAAGAPQAERQWVVDYSGRPPFKRTLQDAELTVDAPAVLAADDSARDARRVGPAGKRPLSTFSQPAETVEFARFEERAGGEGIQPRTLRGAPGKSFRRD